MRYVHFMKKNSSGFKEFVIAGLRDPKKVSTIFPSMSALAQALIRHSGMKEGHNVLELGCGSGAITRHILDGSIPLNSYTGVEIDGDLISFLNSHYPGQRFLKTSADDLKDHIEDESIDAVISTLPWTLFPRELQISTIEEIIRVLKPGGKFTTFLCLHALAYPGAPRAKKIFKEYFTGFEKRVTVAANIPPANVYLGQK
ncbi:MAG: methyltransferase domain-containing protein [Pseudomonadota bacterium]